MFVKVLYSNQSRCGLTKKISPCNNILDIYKMAFVHGKWWQVNAIIKEYVFWKYQSLLTYNLEAGV